MELPFEMQEKIFCSSIETLIISQFLNTHLRKLTNDKFNKLDRNLLLMEFTRSECKFKANKQLIVIYIPNYINGIKYEKRLNSDCFLITSNEYLRIINKDYDQRNVVNLSLSILNRVSYVYGNKFTNQVYVHPSKMIVKKTGGIHENFILTQDKSLKDIYNSKDYIEINFATVSDKFTEVY